ncbi:MAG: nicotinate-nucleotide adenylyltransferase [Saprospirales bacterium]|nr:nicotinate-nucleotide adenylyltransferase [Saprospirales bacterium]
MRQALETEQKALEINLDPSLYGTLAEIGAGQEVARNFFAVGAAAGTIAKTMSAYDKVVSDDIYGPEPSGRYVCESRLYKMLDHEWGLMERRLRQNRPDTNFFVFADTVATLNYQRTIKGDGWLGIRFQLKPDTRPNDLVLHVKMLDNDTQLQQQAIGILGVNLVYACFRYADQPEVMLQSLMDSLQGRVKIDMVRLTGPDFNHLDNRLLSLWLVKNGLTEVAMFDHNGNNVHASEFLYKKNVMVVRASFRPPTLLDADMIRTGFEQFRHEPGVDPSRIHLLTEMTLRILSEDGQIDEEDFLARADLLGALGHTVVVSSCEKYQQLINYLADYKVQNLGLVLRSHRLLNFMSETYYQNVEGRLLAAFGEVFVKNVKLYTYPTQQEGSEEPMTAANLPVPEGLTFLYRHLLDNRQIVDIETFNPEVLSIYSPEILSQIRQGLTGWEDKLPAEVARLIKSKYLFGFPTERLEFEY